MSKEKSSPNPDKRPSTSSFFAYLDGDVHVTHMEVRRYVLNVGSMRLGKLAIHAKTDGELTLSLLDVEPLHF